MADGMIGEFVSSTMKDASGGARGANTRRRRGRAARHIALVAAVAVAACAGLEPRGGGEVRTGGEQAGHDPTAPDAAGARLQPAATPSGDLRLEVDISAREIREYRGGVVANTFPIAVGQPDHPTPTGEWGIHQVDWNPDWTPPDSEWTGDAEYTPPGHPDNPMGRVRMIYMAPYSIHGTDDLESLGRAASHGSIRMANEDITELARRIMEAGGAPRSEAWYEEVLDTPTEMRRVSLRDPVPLVNKR